MLKSPHTTMDSKERLMTLISVISSFSKNKCNLQLSLLEACRCKAISFLAQEDVQQKFQKHFQRNTH